ncbi:restriction endonuclease subunit S [Lactobacillus iners]|uniref:restriction endonuclease subunit S n=1 Tax=Lactobacillus iners TaxID=147802 RepID=UPI0013E1511C|nr:restriction endonuclease subunit S [Lactobacillus iners]MCT7723349.1 restriction endonuclease subunit S [Lactobacillus iners]QIH22175.1 restriction endonuclease subunit S [Lactobacillus iners]
MIELSKAAHYVSDKINVSSVKIEEYITTDNMIPNRGGVVDCESLPKARRVTRYEPGDILISNIRPYFKKIWFSDRISGCSNDVIVFRANDENWNKKFLYYVLSQDSFFDFMMSGSNGTKMPRGNKKTIPEFLIPDFDIDKQIRIADILSAYDDLIENNQKQIKLLEEAAQRLYKEWFVDLHFPGYEDVKIVDGVPEGWSYKRVDDFGEVITGKTPSTSKTEYYGGNIPFVTIPDMHGNVFPLVTEKALTKAGANTQKNKYLPINSVIVSCIATVGLVNIAVEPCQTNQQINSVVLYDDNNLYFFYESMKRIKTLLDGIGSNGATMTNVNKTKFSNIHVLYPTEDLVNRYNEFCKPIFDNILALSKEILVSKKARDHLLPKLMSGEIEV